MEDRDPHGFLPRIGAMAAEILGVYEPGLEPAETIPQLLGLRCLALCQSGRPGLIDQGNDVLVDLPPRVRLSRGA
jgi:hypothetical protein